MTFNLITTIALVVLAAAVAVAATIVAQRRMACLYSCLLCLDGCAGRFHFVACTLVLALLLVQLQFALLQLGVALVGLRLAPGKTFNSHKPYTNTTI